MPCGVRACHRRVGDELFAAGNPFKVAEGPEPVSIAAGVFSGRATLSARRRTQDVAYAGPILLLDMIVATPGFAGGALVDAGGQLVGLIGEPVVSKRTNTMLNYALPAEELKAFVEGRRDDESEGRGRTALERDSSPTTSPLRPFAPSHLDLGLRLFDVGGRTRPAYV